MALTTVIIPNYNGKHFLEDCLRSLERQTAKDFSVLVVDNGSTDGSAAFLRASFPSVGVLALPENTGFTGAVNAGIREAADSRYVILLNNDTVAGRHFVEALVGAMDADPSLFSAQALLRRMDDPALTDDAGDFYTVFGWGFARGKDKPARSYAKGGPIGYACGGAAIFRAAALRELGCFDDAMFAYYEDADVGLRAYFAGMGSILVPGAQVLHKGSGTTGSRYNAFKVRYSSRNSVYCALKNLPAVLLFFNLPFLLAGIAVKLGFFAAKGFGRIYAKGAAEGFLKGISERRRNRAALAAIPVKRVFLAEREFLRAVLIKLWEKAERS